MINFKVGDKVRIKRYSKYYSSSYMNNPIDVNGTVIEIKKIPSYPIIVEWENDLVNGYDKEDLELINEKNMDKLYKLETELTLEDIVQLSAFTGSLNNMEDLFYEVKKIIEQEEVQKVYLEDFMDDFNLNRFQDSVKTNVRNRKRKTVDIAGKSYYESDLEELVKSSDKLKEVK